MDNPNLTRAVDALIVSLKGQGAAVEASDAGRRVTVRGTVDLREAVRHALVAGRSEPDEACFDEGRLRGLA